MKKIDILDDVASKLEIWNWSSGAIVNAWRALLELYKR